MGKEPREEFLQMFVNGEILQGVDLELRRQVKALLAEKEALKEKADKLANVLEHAIALEHYTPGGSTEGWAKQVLKQYREQTEGE